jgi:hypothetical protein
MHSEVPRRAAVAVLLLCLGCVDSSDPSSTTNGGHSATGGSSSAGGSPQETGGTTSIATGCCKEFGSPVEVGQFTFSGLSELSGLVASRANPGVLYAQSDSGTAIVYAMSVTGNHLGTFTLSGVKAIDWEDISVGPGPSSGTYLYVGDIGDNAAREGGGTPRTDIIVYRLPEPSVTVSASVDSQSLTNWERLRFTYPDGAHDAETIMVDPVTGDLLIVTKETSGASKVFRAAGTTPADTTTVLELQATLAIGTSGKDNALVTAGNISPSGDAIILRTCKAIWQWCRQSDWPSTFGAAPSQLPDATEPHGEALTFSYDGRSWYSAGEGAATIYQGLSTCP